MDLAEEQLMCSPNTQQLLVGGHDGDDQPMSYRDAVHVFSSDPVRSSHRIELLNDEDTACSLSFSLVSSIDCSLYGRWLCARKLHGHAQVCA